MSFWSQLGFPDPFSPSMDYLSFFHGYAMVFITTMMILVLYIKTIILYTKFTTQWLFEQQTLEVIWTLVPAIMLMFLAMPSLKMLYLVEELTSPQITLKAIGHQWYWSYEYSTPTKFNNSEINFDSYMTPDNNLNPQDFRNFDVDARPTLPMNIPCRMLTSSTDVIHAWAVHNLGMKTDAVPGRINQMALQIYSPGIYFGNCMELCGANHSFMPMVLEAHPLNNFIAWLN